MAIVRAFRAIRPVPEKAAAVSSVPYDVVTVDEARVLAGGNELSFLHVIRPEIDLPDTTDPYDSSVYRKASENFNQLRQKGVLIQEQEPSLYIYRIKTNGHEQTGVAGCCSVDEYDRDIIRKHEHTRKEKEDDRVRHMLALSAHTGPVLLIYRGDKRLETLFEREKAKAPLYDFTDESGITHTIWRAEGSHDISGAFRNVPFLYIADGHHRAAGASRVCEAMRGKNENNDPAAEYNFFLSVLFPSTQLRILAYNRYVRELNGLTTDRFMDAVRSRFFVSLTKNPAPEHKGIFCMYLAGRWYRLEPKEGTGSDDPVGRLDLSIFQKLLLEPVLGIRNQREDPRIDFVGGIDNLDKLRKMVDRNGGVSFSFYPVGIEELLAVADAGDVMPPKSTWFFPKLRSGLLVHQF